MRESEELKEKFEFFKMLFIRQYIIDYENSLLMSGNHFIYTSDALENLKAYAEKSIKHYHDIYKGKRSNQYCDLTEELLNYLINWVTNIQESNRVFSYIDDEYEEAFTHFFPMINNCKTFDSIMKEQKRQTDELIYWKSSSCGFCDG